MGIVDSFANILGTSGSTSLSTGQGVPTNLDQ